MLNKVVESVMIEEQKPFYVRPLTVRDRNWVAQFMDDHWHSTKIVSRGQSYYAHLLPGFLAIPGSESDHKPASPAGLITYRIEGNQCEIITLDSLQPNMGIGSALIEAVRTVAVEEGCKRLWLITTNDNLNALRFYQKRGLHLVAVYPNALTESRKLKPQIPIMGMDNIPLRDEIELAMDL